MAGGEFTALKPQGDGSTPDVVWKSNKLRPSYATPVYHQGKLYLVAPGRHADLCGRQDGQTLWQLRVKGKLLGSPIVVNDQLYLVNEEGTTAWWTSAVPRGKWWPRNALAESMLATPAVANGALFLRGDQHLFCVGQKR